MKTIDSLQHLLPALACLISGMALTACQTTSNSPGPTRVPMSTAAANWVKVSSQPPTYYPAGVPADCPTDHFSGEWVYTGDERGSRYFIPLHGLDGIRRQILVADALGNLSDQKRNQINAEDWELNQRAVRNVVLFGPLVASGVTLAAMAGVDPGDLDYSRLQSEWHTSKHPGGR